MCTFVTHIRCSSHFFVTIIDCTQLFVTLSISVRESDNRIRLVNTYTRIPLYIHTYVSIHNHRDIYIYKHIYVYLHTLRLTYTYGVMHINTVHTKYTYITQVSLCDMHMFMYTLAVRT